MLVAHLSDLHLGGCLHSCAGLLDKRLLGTAIFLFNRLLQHRSRWVGRALDRLQELQPDVVVITGDVTSLGTPREFRRAVDILQPALRNMTVLYVPGNHDAYTADPACVQALDAGFHALNQQRWHRRELPVAFTTGQLEFILVDQAAPTPWFCARGRLPEAAGPRLQQLLETPAAGPRVLVSHYPLFNADGRPLPPRRASETHAGLLQAWRDGAIQVALCGHIHHPFVRTDARGNQEVCAGSLTQHGRIDLLHYDPATRAFEQEWEQLEPAG